MIAAAWWVRSGCTTDVARGLVGASSREWDSWLDLGRIELERGDDTLRALLVHKLELADALRRAEVLRTVHSYVLRDPTRLLDYLARRWPDALADTALALGPAASPAAASSLVDHVLDAAAIDVAASGGEGDAREPDTAGPGDGGVVGDEPPNPRHR